MPRRATKTKSGKVTTKTAFVLQFAGVPAKDIVEKAKAEGFKLTEKFVYTIRSNAKAAIRKKASRRRVPAPGAATATGKGVTAPAEHVLYAVAAQLGLDRAVELLQAQQKIVRAILAQ